MIVNQSDPVAPPVKEAPPVNIVRVVIWSAFFLAVLAGSVLIDLPLFTMNPGPTPNAAELIKVEAPQTYPLKGSLHITTVQLYQANLIGVMWGWIDGDVEVVPRSAVYPKDRTPEETDIELAAQMDESQYTASLSALTELGYALEPDGALVRSLVKGTPAAEQLHAGDVIVAIDRVPIRQTQDLVDRMNSRPIGGEVTISVLRDNNRHDFKLKTVSSRGAEPRPVVGMNLLQNFKLPFPITIDDDNIGGPSAGLIFALTIVDLLEPDDLTHGTIIAGTGEIFGDGSVHPIGGVAQKIAAAERLHAKTFLVPVDELDEARRALDSDMRLIGVRTLHEAVTALRGG